MTDDFTQLVQNHLPDGYQINMTEIYGQKLLQVSFPDGDVTYCMVRGWGNEVVAVAVAEYIRAMDHG